MPKETIQQKFHKKTPPDLVTILQKSQIDKAAIKEPKNEKPEPQPSSTPENISPILDLLKSDTRISFKNRRKNDDENEKKKQKLKKLKKSWRNQRFLF